MSSFFGNNGPVVVISTGFGVVNISIVPHIVNVIVTSEDTDRLGNLHVYANLYLIKIMVNVWIALAV